FYANLLFRQALFSEFFVPTQPLALLIGRSFSSAGGAFYSDQTRCQAPRRSSFWLAAGAAVEPKGGK
ncbi:hypothetical protein, partial [Pseudomonas citronellolis]|uniref:hypothetical protein n=1 Tax=Pseudomonas citronellolis TaxID=53408 RepID=UPI001955F30A